MRRILLILGLLALAAAWLMPVPQLARHTFWGHMTMHMVVVAVAAPLLALGVAGGRLDPVPKAPKLFAPVPASVVELVVVWAWHAPLLHHAARHSTVGLLAEQGTFLLTGLAVWLSAFGGDSQCHPSRRAAGVVGLLLTSMHMTLLGALLALAPRPLYHHVAHASLLTPPRRPASGGSDHVARRGHLLSRRWPLADGGIGAPRRIIPPELASGVHRASAPLAETPGAQAL